MNPTQTINLGTAANAGDGDNDRGAWTKAKALFIELYARLPVYVSGRYYWPHGSLCAQALAGSALPAANTAWFIPIPNPTPITVDQLIARVSTAVASSNVQLAYYNDNNGKPGTEICHSVSLSAAATGGVSGALSTAGTAVIPAGIIWMGINTDISGVGIMTINSSIFLASALMGSTTIANLMNSATAPSYAVSTPLTFGTWGDLTSATWTETAGTGRNGLVGFRVA